MDVFQLSDAAPGIFEITDSTSTGGAAAALAAAGIVACADVDAGAAPDVTDEVEAAGEEATTAGCDGGKILARMLLKMLTGFS